MTVQHTDPRPQDLLARAADVITERGWNQGGYMSHDGRVCVLGALRIAAADAPADEARRVALDVSDYSGPEDGDAVEAAALVLRDHLGGQDVATWDVSAWNDHSRRTAGEVVAALRAAGGAR